jgi:hypothetical protein
LGDASPGGGCNLAAPVDHFALEEEIVRMTRAPSIKTRAAFGSWSLEVSYVTVAGLASIGVPHLRK